MPLPDSVAQLIENYAANRSEYRKGDYNETQTRVDYVNPLFAALGWDMDNHEGLSELLLTALSSCGFPRTGARSRIFCFTRWSTKAARSIRACWTSFAGPMPATIPACSKQ